MILLVEDEEALRAAVALLLEKNGFAVLSTADGTAAVNMFRERMNDIDVVLLDATLPGLSGAEVYREVLRLKPQTKVVLTSAYDLDKISLEFASAGETPPHFIRKPYRVSDLVRSLQQVFLQQTTNGKPL